MLGAIVGDIVGSIYQNDTVKQKDFKLGDVSDFIDKHPDLRVTDDSLLSFAVSTVLKKNYPIQYDQASVEKIQDELRAQFIKAVIQHPDAGYGAMFYEWCTRVLDGDKRPYNSYGNGAAMRIFSVGWLAKSEDEVKKLSRIVTEITHNHPEGLNGAECVAMCIYKALHGATKEDIKDYVINHYYSRIDLIDYQDLIDNYKFNATCVGSVPEAIYCFLISNSLQDTIEKCISIGGDTDTIACIAGSIAEAYYRDSNTILFVDKFQSIIEKYFKFDLSDLDQVDYYPEYFDQFLVLDDD